MGGGGGGGRKGEGGIGEGWWREQKVVFQVSLMTG